MSTKPAFVYTLVAYRANGVDTCRNCVMGQSNSDFELNVFTDAEALAKHWAKHQFNAPHGREYGSFEYTLLLNGRDEYNDPSWDDEAECDPVTGELWASLERTRIREMVDAESAALNEARRLEEERKAAAEALKQQARRQRDQAAAEARDREEFARLQAKFGGTR